MASGNKAASFGVEEMNCAKLYTAEQFYKEYCTPQTRILNAGCGLTRYGENCLNMDCQGGPEVDSIGDLHFIIAYEEFEVIICNAVLQYCENPQGVVTEFCRALKPNGWIFVDVPFVQPIGDCGKMKDLWRFSEAGLRHLFEDDFEILACGASVRPGDALSFFGIKIAQQTTGKNKIINYLLGKIAQVVLLPLRWIKTAKPTACAGAIYLIGRKK